MRARWRMVPSSRSGGGPRPMGPHFGTVAAALHRAPAAVSAARRVQIDESAVLSRALADAPAGLRSEQPHGIPGDRAQGLVRSGIATTGLTSAAAQRGRDVRGCGEQIDHVHGLGSQCLATAGLTGETSDRLTERLRIRELARSRGRSDLGKTRAQPIVEFCRIPYGLSLTGLGIQSACVGEVEGEGSGVEPPALPIRRLDPLTGASG